MCDLCKKECDLRCDRKERRPHVHAELIKAWADGAEIQYWGQVAEEWFDVDPFWDPQVKYRIKPEPSDVEKYGIEVGDFWCVEDSDAEVVTEVGKSRIKTYIGNSYPKDEFITLIFRRGVVNKL